MECSALLQRSEQQWLAGTITNTDKLPLDVKACLPQLCDELYGSANFDLAGAGIYWSLMIQAVLFLLFGPLQAVVSRCISPHASSATRLLVARCQAVMDTVYAIGCGLSLAYLITGYVRASGGPLAGIERNVIRDFMDMIYFLMNLSMVSYFVQSQPAKTIYPSKRFDSGRSYMIWMAFSTSLYVKDKVSRMGSAVAPSFKFQQTLCHTETSNPYPSLMNPDAVVGYSPWIVGAGIGVGLVVVGLVAAFLLPKIILSWITAFFGSRMVQSALVTLWSLLAIFCVFVPGWHLTYLRQYYEDAPSWDFAQIAALLPWGWSLLHIVATFGAWLRPGKAGTFEVLYRECFGRLPYIQDDSNTPSMMSEEQLQRIGREFGNVIVKVKMEHQGDETSEKLSNLPPLPPPIVTYSLSPVQRREAMARAQRMMKERKDSPNMAQQAGETSEKEPILVTIADSVDEKSPPSPSRQV